MKQGNHLELLLWSQDIEGTILSTSLDLNIIIIKWIPLYQQIKLVYQWLNNTDFFIYKILQKLNGQSVKYSESISLQQLGRATSRQQEYTQHIHDWIKECNEQLTVILDQLLLQSIMDVDSTTLVPTASASNEVAAGSLLTQQPENYIGSEIQSVTEDDIMAKVQEKIIQTAVTIATNTALTASIGGSVILDKVRY